MNESRRTALKAADWRAILEQLGSELSDEERMIVESLSQGASQGAIGEKLGFSRSYIWRKARAIAERRR